MGDEKKPLVSEATIAAVKHLQDRRVQDRLDAEARDNDKKENES